jgi:hypothetical protein
VTIVGVARTLLGVEAGHDVPWPEALTPRELDRLDVRTAILATSVRTADGVDLTSAGLNPDAPCQGVRDQGPGIRDQDPPVDGSLKDRPGTSRDQVNDEQHDRDHEQDVGDLRRDAGDAGNSKHSGDQADNEKNQGVIQHVRQLPTAQ